MTTSHARGIKQDVLNDNSVGDYLLTYPDFFERNRWDQFGSINVTFRY